MVWKMAVVMNIFKCPIHSTAVSKKDGVKGSFKGQITIWLNGKSRFKFYQSFSTLPSAGLALAFCIF